MRASLEEVAAHNELHAAEGDVCLAFHHARNVIQLLEEFAAHHGHLVDDKHLLSMQLRPLFHSPMHTFAVLNLKPSCAVTLHSKTRETSLEFDDGPVICVMQECISSRG